MLYGRSMSAAFQVQESHPPAAAGPTVPQVNVHSVPHPDGVARGQVKYTA